MITNYGELKAEVANWLDREDQTANIPKFIKLAESKIYRKLRTRENEFLLEITEATIPEPLSPITLPDNFREAHLLTLDGTPLEMLSSQKFQMVKGSNYQGVKTYFTIIERKLHIHPWPETTPDDWGTFKLTMLYYGTESLGEMATWPTPTNPNMVPESDGTPATTTERTDASTTRLLQVAPDAYLYAALTEAYMFLREPQKAAEWGSGFGAVMAELMEEDALATFSGSTAAVNGIYGDR